LGRIFNVLRRDRRRQSFTPKKNEVYYNPIHRSAPLLTEQETRPQVLETGLKVIDLIAPFTKTEKIAVFGGAGVGKQLSSKSLSEYRHRHKGHSGFLRGSEKEPGGNDLMLEMKEAGVMTRPSWCLRTDE